MPMGNPRRAGPGGEILQTWCTGEGNGKPLQDSCLENLMNSMKRQKGMTLKDETPRSESATGEEWGNKARRNAEAEQK